MTREELKLIDAWLDDDLSDADAAELDSWLRADPANLEAFARAGILHRRLRDSLRARAMPNEAEVLGRRGSGAGDVQFGDLAIWRFGDFKSGDSGVGIGDSGFGIRGMQIPNPKSQIPNHQILSPLTIGGPVFSYIAATLILGVMLLGAWAYKITRDYGPSRAINSSYAKNSRGLTAPGEPAQRPEIVFVARVTGMSGCRWTDPATETIVGAYVPLGRKYALSSGLMEITYRNGAKVILEGPCRYEAESSAGGFLELGKLTAKVESENQSPKTQDLSPKTQITKSPNHQISKSFFTVRTPTAVVTDLGTEFGVVVKPDKETQVHVFRGKVEAEWFGPGGAAEGRAVLTEGQAAEYDAAQSAVVPLSARPQDFARAMPRRSERLIDAAAKKTIVKWSGVYRYGDPTKGTSDWETLERFGVWHVNDGITDESEQGKAYWKGREKTPDEYFIIYLAGRFEVERIELMNTHNGPGNDRGTKDFEIWAADEVNQENELVSPRLVLRGTLPCRFGAGPTIPFDIFSAAAGDFQRFNARYVKFVAKTYYEGENFGGCGLNEIRLIGVPAGKKP